MIAVTVTPRVAAIVTARFASNGGYNHPITRSAERFQPALRKLMRASFRAAEETLSLKRLEQALWSPGWGAVSLEVEEAIDAMIDVLDGAAEEMRVLQAPVALYPMLRAAADKKPTVKKIAQRAYGAAGNVGAKVANIPITFNAANPSAVAWAAERAAELVTGIRAEAREAIRTTVTTGLDMGANRREVASLIRSNIGLTNRDAQAVMNRQSKLIAEGMNLEKATARAEKYAAKLLRQRADTIAVNETLVASAEGQRGMWRDAQAQGLLSASLRKTLVQADPCPKCSIMAGEIVGINDEFSGGLPPFHIRCMCSEGIVA